MVDGIVGSINDNLKAISNGVLAANWGYGKHVLVFQLFKLKIRSKHFVVHRTTGAQTFLAVNWITANIGFYYAVHSILLRIKYLSFSRSSIFPIT